MARKRMIDPNIWESAFDKDWKAEDTVVMISAISCADDEGRGRISMIYKNCSKMISEKKFQKSLAILSDSLIIFEKIYYFLPKWNEYQSISHPKPSKIPKPKLLENNNLIQNSSVNGTGTIPERSDVVKSNIVKVSLNKVKVREEDQKQEQKPLTFETSSSYFFTPKDFYNDEQLRATLILMLARFCKITNPEKAEITRFFNIITKTENIVAKGETVSRQFTHRIALENFQEYMNFEEKKRNLAYLSTKIIGKINDLMILDKEKKAKSNQNDLNKDINEFMNGPPKDDVFNNIRNFANGFAKEHKF